MEAAPGPLSQREEEQKAIKEAESRPEVAGLLSADQRDQGYESRPEVAGGQFSANSGFGIFNSMPRAACRAWPWKSHRQPPSSQRQPGEFTEN